MRIFTKIGWQHDTDCRLENTPQGRQFVIAPPLPPLPPHSLADGNGGRYRPRSNPGSFRPAGSIRRFLRYMNYWASKHTKNRKTGKYNWA